MCRVVLWLIAHCGLARRLPSKPHQANGFVLAIAGQLRRMLELRSRVTIVPDPAYRDEYYFARDDGTCGIRYDERA
jgi:hypothetical protein